jgi:hypothetical protein
MTTFLPNFGKIRTTTTLPGYYQIPIETTQDFHGEQLYKTDHQIKIFINNALFKTVTLDDLLVDIVVGNHNAIVNINPDPSEPDNLGLLFIQLSHDDVDALDELYDTVEIKVYTM